MNAQCQVTVNEDFAETWTWLKKKLRIQFGDCTSSSEYVDLMTAIINNKWKQFTEQKGSNDNNFNKKKKNANNQNNAGGNTSGNAPKQCTYCRKKGHGQLTCWKCKGDKAPCINANGEAYYTKEAKTKTNVGSNPQPQPKDQPQEGVGFSWLALKASLLQAPRRFCSFVLQICVASIASINNFKTLLYLPLDRDTVKPTPDPI
jgi:hypothetical protein